MKDKHGNYRPFKSYPKVNASALRDKLEPRHCFTCEHWDGREGIEDCGFPNADLIPDDLDEPCTHWQPIRKMPATRAGFRPVQGKL